MNRIINDVIAINDLMALIIENYCYLSENSYRSEVFISAIELDQSFQAVVFKVRQLSIIKISKPYTIDPYIEFL